MEVVRALRQINFGGSGAASLATTDWVGSAVPRTTREAYGKYSAGLSNSGVGTSLGLGAPAQSYRCRHARVGCWLTVPSGALSS
jgi:hypothetical protein